MTDIQLKHGPFAHAVTFWPGRDHVVTCGAGERIKLVRKSTDAGWLEAVIAHKHTQASVRKAAERRLVWVNKAVQGLIAKYKEQNPKS